MRTYKGFAYLPHVNNMPGYFEDHDTTKTKKSSKYRSIIWTKERNEYIMPRKQKKKGRKEARV